MIEKKHKSEAVAMEIEMSNCCAASKNIGILAVGPTNKRQARRAVNPK